MPVIAFANPKGGTGKSTTALVVGTRLATNGYHVTIIDADPRQVVYHWKYKGFSKNKINVIGKISESSIVKIIQDRAKIDEIVIIDLEGTASLLLSRAISRSDLVLIPMQASALDARGASDVLKIIEEEEDTFQRKIDARIVFTRTNPAIVTKIERNIINELKLYNKPYLSNHLCQRQAYSLMFATLKDLSELDNINKETLSKAIYNADLLSNEIISILEEKQGDYNV